jgi:hypothetical protein
LFRGLKSFFVEKRGMSTLIDRVFSKSDADAIKKLWQDNSSRLLLMQEVGKKIVESDQVLNELPLSQLTFIVSLSPFAESDEERNNVATIIYWGINRTDILPMITEHRGKDLAYRCLISLGFYKNQLTLRCERRGAPSPSFYRKVGIATFDQIGMAEVGRHFTQWEYFMNDFFV